MSGQGASEVSEFPYTRQSLATLVSEARAMSAALVADRRRFHGMPELGWAEVATTAEIAAVLRDLGYRVVAGHAFLKDAVRLGLEDAERSEGRGDTGCVAIVDSGRPGPTIAVRIDVDALPIDEAHDHHRPTSEGWVSQAPGVMHACGHDGHIAIGLGLARLLRSRMDRACGRLKLIFQPAEEGTRGARSVVEAGWLDDVDLLLGFHVGVGLPSGTVALGTRGFLATQKYRVTYMGRSAHAGKSPEEGRNALLGACSATLALHGLAQSSQPGIRVNVGMLRSGRALNIVPDLAEMLVELRAETENDLGRLVPRAAHLVEGVARAYELGWTMDLIGEATDWTNDESVAAAAHAICAEGGIFREHLMAHNFGASEDATLMAKAVAGRGGRGAYFVFGADLASGHHTPQFDFDENVLPEGLALLAALAASGLRAL